MQNEQTKSASPTSTQAPCRHLRSKEMFYEPYGAPEDQFSSGVYWCGKTQEPFGPDGEPCGKSECCGQRSCFK